MERHRLFNLETALSLMGLEVDDWIIIVGSWTLMLQLFGLVLTPRPRLLVATLVAGMVFLLHRRLKDRVPQKFARHLLTYLNEADAYRVVPDTYNLPHVVAMNRTPRQGADVHAART